MVYFHVSTEAQRLMALYREQPALRLTCGQAARLLNLPVAQCEPVLRELLGAGRLARTAGGVYVADTGAEVPCDVPNRRRAV